MKMNLLLALSFLISAPYYGAGASANSSIGFDTEILHKRPSYRNLYEPCIANAEEFKTQYYLAAYRAGISAGVSYTSLSPWGVRDALANKGLSPFLGTLLNQEATTFALRDCLGDQDQSFVRNLFVVDSLGKFVGVAITVSGGKLMSFTAKKIFGQLALISPVLAKRAFIGTFLAGSGAAYYTIYKDLKNQESPSRDSAGSDLNVKKVVSANLNKIAHEQLAVLRPLLQNPQITLEEKEKINNEIQNWELILKSVSF